MNHVKENDDDDQKTNRQLYTFHNNQNKHPNNFDNFLLSVSPGLDGGIMYIKNYTYIYSLK